MSRYIIKSNGENEAQAQATIRRVVLSARAGIEVDAAAVLREIMFDLEFKYYDDEDDD